MCHLKRLTRCLREWSYPGYLLKTTISKTTISKEHRTLIRILKRNLFHSVFRIRVELIRRNGRCFFVRIAQRCLLAAGHCSRYPERFTRLNSEHRRCRAMLAHRHQNCIDQHWSDVLFVDESITSLYNCKGPWWRHQMDTFSASLAICAGNSPVSGEFPAQRPVTRSFDVFFDLRLNKRLSKQWWDCWFETLSRPLWRHCNACSNFRSFCWKASGLLHPRNIWNLRARRLEW